MLFGLDHVMLRVSDLEKSVAFYRTFFGNERPRTNDKPARVWFQIGNTRLGLEAGAGGQQACRGITSASPSLASIAFKQLDVESSPSSDEKLLRFRDPHGIVVELKSA